MDTSDEEEIQAESQQTPEQIAAGLGAKKKEQERLRNLVAQKQQTSSLPALSNQLANRRRNTNPGGKRKEEKGGEKKGKIYFGVSICPQNRLKKNSPPAAEQRPAGCARSTSSCTSSAGTPASSAETKHWGKGCLFLQFFACRAPPASKDASAQYPPSHPNASSIQ